MSEPGIVVFLPWVTLPGTVGVGGFEFVPLEAGNIKRFFTDDDTAASIAAMLRGVRRHHEPADYVLHVRYQADGKDALVCA
jgi:hypothetical protein